jgi:hypothetical protein
MKKQSTHPRSKPKRSQAPRKSKKILPEAPPAAKKPSKRTKLSGLDTDSKRQNTSGLAILPDELLLEVLSYYPDSKPEVSEYSRKDADAHFSRRERLIALSETCRNLRRFLRPYVWCRIEVLDRMTTAGEETLKTEQQLALELVRQLEIVTIRDPSLAEYVKYVNKFGFLDLLPLPPFFKKKMEHSLTDGIRLPELSMS